MQKLNVSGVEFSCGSMADAVNALQSMVNSSRSGYVVFSNVHSFTLALDDPDFRASLNDASLCLPDGWPVAFWMRRSGMRKQRRVAGPDFMGAYLSNVARDGGKVLFYGSSPATLERLQVVVQQRYPGLRADFIAPPFRQLTPDEEDAVIARFNASGASTIWVGLGCPKQELWMRRVSARVIPVMLGVGAAFEFEAGTKPRAPLWMRSFGLEWVHRLYSEPNRLWRRYLGSNFRFVFEFAAFTARQCVKLLLQPKWRNR